MSSTTITRKQISSSKAEPLPFQVRQKKKKDRTSEMVQILPSSTQYNLQKRQRESLSDWNHAS